MLLSVVVSTLVTGLIQSSGATMSILLSLASQVRHSLPSIHSSHHTGEAQNDACKPHETLGLMCIHAYTLKFSYISANKLFRKQPAYIR